ncbi:MAG TPA: hypothetical protein VJS42_03420, partial [Steroidobacteraceae bacterium]|nr:hypothetical protein [Steroidobacteraceae bacterium]
AHGRHLSRYPEIHFDITCSARAQRELSERWKIAVDANCTQCECVQTGGPCVNLMIDALLSRTI